jgi:hypothetical protein
MSPSHTTGSRTEIRLGARAHTTTTYLFQKPLHHGRLDNGRYTDKATKATRSGTDGPPSPTTPTPRPPSREEATPSTRGERARTRREAAERMASPPQRGHPHRHSSPVSIRRGVYPGEVANECSARPRGARANRAMRAARRGGVRSAQQTAVLRSLVLHNGATSIARPSPNYGSTRWEIQRYQALAPASRAEPEQIMDRPRGRPDATSTSAPDVPVDRARTRKLISRIQIVPKVSAEARDDRLFRRGWTAPVPWTRVAFSNCSL